jgi:hypothetical protein
MIPALQRSSVDVERERGVDLVPSASLEDVVGVETGHLGKGRPASDRFVQLQERAKSGSIDHRQHLARLPRSREDNVSAGGAIERFPHSGDELLEVGDVRRDLGMRCPSIEHSIASMRSRAEHPKRAGYDLLLTLVHRFLFAFFSDLSRCTIASFVSAATDCWCAQTSVRKAMS